MRNTKFFAMAAMVAAVVFTSCEKYENINSEEDTNGSKYAHNWQWDTNKQQPSTNKDELEDNGEFICYKSGLDKAYFYYDSEGNITQQQIYKGYETSEIAKNVYVEMFGDVAETTDADGNNYHLNGFYIVTYVAPNKIKFNTKEMVKKFAGSQLFTK